jgi:hypothetical protein
MWKTAKEVIIIQLAAQAARHEKRVDWSVKQQENIF